MKDRSNNKKGFSLLEMILYIAILSFMLFIIANILVSISRSERTLKSSKSAANSAIFSLDRIVEEVRAADSVDTSTSVLDSSPGSLTLKGEDSSGNARTVQFYVTSGALHIKDNGVDMGSLSQSDSTVTNLTFSLLTSSSTEAVRTQITVESGTSTAYKQEKFYATTILRGSI